MRNRTIAVLTSLLWLGVCGRIVEGQNVIQTIAGGGPNNLPALKSSLGYPTGIAWDAAGSLYVFDGDSQRVLKKDSSSGSVSVAAGSGVWGFADGPTLNAQFAAEGNIAIDSSGNILIADSENCRIRKVDTSGNTATIAGNGTCGYSGDGPALSVSISSPQSVFVDASGNVFIAEIDNCIIRKLSANTGNLTTVAGTPLMCGYSGDGARATNASLKFPWSVAVDGAGNIFIADLGNAVIREVSAATGNIATIAGNFILGPGYSGDDGPATNAQLNWPLSIALNASGDIFIADLNNSAVREVVAATGNISTVAGMPCTNCAGIADSGDGGPATQAQIGFPLVVAISGSGDLLIGTTEGLIRDVANGTIATIAGTTRIDPETEATVGIPTLSGDTYPALQASIEYPLGLATDNSGNIFIADSSAAIREITASSGIITTVAGTGISGSSGDGGPALDAKLSLPSGVAVDGHGNIFIADSFNCVVREVFALTGTIQTVAGMMNSCGYSGDGGAATSAQLSEMSGISLDSMGNIFIADFFNYVIREVTAADGKIHTVAGSGVLGNSGDGGPATSAELNPWSVLVDGSGNIFITDTNNCAVREVTADGKINTIAGTNGVCGFSGDGGPATQAQLGILSSQIYLDAAGNLFIPDFGNAVVWKLDTTSGNINVVVGNGTYGFSGDGGPALSAELSWPTAAGADTSGNLLVLDGLRVRSVNGLVPSQPKAQATMSPAFIAFETQLIGTSAPPRSITVANPGNASVTISTLSISGSNRSDFQESDNCSGKTLTPGGSCTVQVTFTASSAGNESAALTVSSSSGAKTASLVGAGADFAMAASSGVSTSAAVNAGETAEYPLQLAAFGGASPIARSGVPNANRTSMIPVTVTCAGAPAGATCNVPPTILVAIGTEVPFTVSVNTTARQNTAAVIQGDNVPGATLAIRGSWHQCESCALFIFAALMFMLPACARLRVMRCTLALGLISVGLGCGTSGAVTPQALTAGTAAGTYTLNVTATSGKDSHTTQLTLTVR
jgi:trimeric autotransporter adhesin